MFRPNVSTVIGPDHQLSLIALTEIMEGEEISPGYMSGELPTTARRSHLSQSWHFLCTCARCSDPRECGSSYSSLQCNEKR